MGILLLFITLTVEIVFAGYCIFKKQNYKKIKDWVRVSIFSVFLILTLTSVIVWSFRWVLISIVLFILAAMGAISLTRNKTNTKKFKRSTIVWKSIILVFTFVFAFSPAVVFPQHKSPKVTGEYEIKTATYTYVDKERKEEFTDTEDNRFVNVEFWYPENAKEKFPLVVFSHGATGVKSSNTSTYKELASHGYIVVSIDHPYHSFYTASEDGTKAFINKDYNLEISNLNKEGIYAKKEIYELIQKWMKLRTDDMNFVIDTILEKVKTDKDAVYRQIDTEKIGVFGHSMGGAASVCLGGERKGIDAVVNIDAPFFSELGYDEKKNDFVASTASYTVPLFNIYSDDVWTQLESNSLYVANKLNNEQFKEAYTTHFEGAEHLSFTDLSLVSPILANVLQGGKANIDNYYCIETENELILNFFDYKLKGVGHFIYEETY